MFGVGNPALVVPLVPVQLASVMPSIVSLATPISFWEIVRSNCYTLLVTHVQENLEWKWMRVIITSIEKHFAAS